MLELNNTIQNLVGQFVQEVTALARDAAMRSLSAAITSAPAAPTASRAASTSRATTARTRVAKGEKRPAQELERVMQSVVAHVTANPGDRVEHIKKALGLETRELSLPIRKLIAEGTLRSEGQKRSTTYHLASKRSKKAA